MSLIIQSSSSAVDFCIGDVMSEFPVSHLLNQHTILIYYRAYRILVKKLLSEIVIFRTEKEVIG